MSYLKKQISLNKNYLNKYYKDIKDNLLNC